MVQRVEELPARLQPHPLGHGKGPHDGRIEGLHPRTIDGIASHVSEGIRRRGREGARIEPLLGIVCAVGEDLLAGKVGANRVLAQCRACVGSIAKDRDGHGIAALYLEDGGEAPVLRQRSAEARAVPRRRVIDAAERKAMAYVAGRAELGLEIIIVLRNGRFIHR